MQPPPRGCVLKQQNKNERLNTIKQPPPRGCVLKLFSLIGVNSYANAAASARLCVETIKGLKKGKKVNAAASARLCVETYLHGDRKMKKFCSRLRAAVC